jgi:hypothetical protein
VIGEVACRISTSGSVYDAGAADRPVVGFRSLQLALPRSRVQFRASRVTSGMTLVRFQVMMIAIANGPAAVIEPTVPVTPQFRATAPDADAFEVPPRRWVIEHTLAWIGMYRRCALDYERLPASHEAMVLWAMIAPMTPAPCRRRPPRRFIKHQLGGIAARRANVTGSLAETNAQAGCAMLGTAS